MSKNTDRLFAPKLLLFFNFFSSHRKSPYICIFSQSFIEICLKFKFLCSKTDFLKKNIQTFCTLKKKNMSISSTNDL